MFFLWSVCLFTLFLFYPLLPELTAEVYHLESWTLALPYAFTHLPQKDDLHLHVRQDTSPTHKSFIYGGELEQRRQRRPAYITIVHKQNKIRASGCLVFRTLCQISTRGLVTLFNVCGFSLPLPF